MSGLRPSALFGLAGLAALSGCMGDPLPVQTPDFSIAAYPSWRESDQAYRFYPGNELRDPAMVITPTEFGSQKVVVGGEVKQAGVFELPGEIDVLQAILLAGGWTNESQPTRVIVMRRRPSGEMMTRLVDVRNGLARRDLYDIGPPAPL